MDADLGALLTDPPVVPMGSTDREAIPFGAGEALSDAAAWLYYLWTAGVGARYAGPVLAGGAAQAPIAGVAVSGSTATVTVENLPVGTWLLVCRMTAQADGRRSTEAVALRVAV